MVDFFFSYHHCVVTYDKFVVYIYEEQGSFDKREFSNIKKFLNNDYKYLKVRYITTKHARRNLLLFSRL